MKKELIKTPEYLLVVDDSEIKEGDYYLSKISDDVFRRGIGGHWIENYDKKMYHKIIAHLPLNNSPILEGVPLLPLLKVEDDVFTDAQEYAIESGSPNKEARRKGYVDGYNKAIEKYKFTEEDAKYLFECGRNFQINADITFTVAREHLSQPKIPTHFEFEIERKSVLNLGIEPFNPNTHVYTNEPKTTTNSQGQEVACGKYIY
jgi:hypothetical protein